MHEITSAQNAQYKNAKQLRVKKYREKQQKFLLEGSRYIETAVATGRKCHALFKVKESNFELSDIPTYILTNELFDALSGTENSQGVIGVFDIKEPMHLDCIEPSVGNILFLDRIQDPGNLGTMIRTADASGIRLVLLAKGTVDVYNDKVVRSAAGSLLNVECLYVDSSESALNMLKQKGFNLVVTALRGAVDYNLKTNYRETNCLVIGNEANGVSDEIISMADVVVKIPISGEAESLNASVAAGIMMYKIKEFEK